MDVWGCCGCGMGENGCCICVDVRGDCGGWIGDGGGVVWGVRVRESVVVRVRVGRDERVGGEWGGGFFGGVGDDCVWWGISFVFVVCERCIGVFLCCRGGGVGLRGDGGAIG